MKWLKRLSALLLTALLLCGTGVAEETEDGLEAIEGTELELGLDGLEGSPDVPDDLSLPDGLELVYTAPEAAAADSAPQAAGNEDSDPFDIGADGVLIRYSGSNSAVNIPDRATAIGRNAFMGNTRLTSVTIPAGVSAIQANAFSGCRNLKAVYVLAGDIEIAANAFSGARPTFYTVIGSTAAKWARKHGFKAEDNLVVPGKGVRIEAGIGDTLRIFLNGEKAVTFYSSNTSVATVSEDGVVSVKNGGTTQITVWLEDWTPLYLTLSVAYPEASLSDRSVILNVGSTRTLTVDNLSGRTVSWFSSDIGIATVRGGLVTAVQPGACTVTATLSDGTALRCAVTVRDSAALSRTSLSMKAGYTHRLIVNGLANRPVHWSSSNSGVASVKNGLVSANKAGACTVTAQIQNGKALRCKVTVRDAAKLSRTSVTLKVGGSITLTVKERGNRTVSWSSGNRAVATVQGGKIVARKAGSCTVTARLTGGKNLTCKVIVTENK